MLKFYAHKLLRTSEGQIPMNISFAVNKGEFITLFGVSGAGKTTILRILAGLTLPDQSKIEIDDTLWNSSEKCLHLSTQKREVGFVFQDFALFPNMTVKENLEFAISGEKDKGIITELLDMMELQSLQNSRPDTLSGGQKQRVALARAIVRKPKLLLLDEPFSALDDQMRFKLQEYILRVHKHFNLTTILVTHNLPELFKLSDRVIVIERGRIIKEGSPAEVFTHDKLSSKFKLIGEIIGIERSDIVYVVSVLTGNNIIKVIATNDEIQNLAIGQKVMVASKAFNPMIVGM